MKILNIKNAFTCGKGTVRNLTCIVTEHSHSTELIVELSHLFYTDKYIPSQMAG